jgi:serine/threonine protein kinase
LPGQIVDGKYRVETLLGRGGMGAVFRAVHLGTDRIVALKVINPAMADQPEYLARFSREARACGRLRHPGIVDVTDFGVATHQGHPLAYLVMEFLDGGTLADALKTQPRPPMTWVIDILEQVCSAVEEAHRQGILHRDLKPENIWLEPNRRGGYSVKVLDFGLAKIDAGDRLEEAAVGRAAKIDALHRDAAMTLAGTMELPDATIAHTLESASSAMSSVSGTPAYMSPEQTRGELVTARSDVYSLGVIAYRMITGRLPFEGSTADVLNAQLNLAAPSIRAIRPDVHRDAENLVAAALSKDPAARPASAGVFGNMLAAQLEPAGAFFRRATLLLIDHSSTFVKIAALACGPLLALCVVLALWQLGARALSIPPLGSTGAIVGLVAVGVFAFASQMALGAVSLVVAHAMATPLKRLEIRELWHRNRARLRRWARSLLPFLLLMAVIIGLMFLSPVVLRWMRPWLRELPRAVRVLVVVPVALAPVAAGVYVLKRRGLGFRATGLLAAVMLVENLPFQSATRRSSELTERSGGLRAAVQKWYIGVITITSMVFGAFLGAKGASGANAESLIAWLPLVAVVFTAFLTVNAVFGSLMYLSARRAAGESMEQIAADIHTVC